MPVTSTIGLGEVLKKNRESLLADWSRDLAGALSRQKDLIRDSELKGQCADFLDQLIRATQSGEVANIQGPHWAGIRDLLNKISASRAVQGFTPTETATFVFSFKKPLFGRLKQEFGQDVEGLFRETWSASLLLDELGIYTTDVYQKSRENVINRQQREMMELSTPVIKLFDKVLALPLIGTLDSARTQTVMESLLKEIVASGSEIAILDITGVPTVDTVVAQHLIKTVTAARLMGAECIISGIRPQIAQTIVHLGINLSDIVTKATLADAFEIALEKTGFSVVQARPEE
ncbi:MAG TPA: STAS domain-containing protein [Planctomycetota bacterium]|nr:STAS domain-containing protein [Planctomycetota bacterium]